MGGTAFRYRARRTGAWSGAVAGKRARRLGAAAAVLLGASGLVGTPYAFAAPAQTFTVNSTDYLTDGTCDGSHCSLREAVNAANATPAEDAIHFDIAGNGPHVIQPTELVFVFNPVTIDASTEPDYAGTPVVQLDGSLAGSTDAVQFQNSGSLLRAVSITGYNGTGVWLRDPGNAVEASWIGVAPDGSADGNSRGITAGGTGSRVGGPDVGDGNVVAGSFGVGIAVGSNVLVEGNIVGLGPDGEQPALSPNPFSNLNGIELNGSAAALTNSVIRGNVVSGNRQEGIQVAGANATGIVVEDNLVGTDDDGEVSIGNGSGFRGINVIFGAHDNTVDGNVVAGHNIGILLSGPGTSGNVITGNHVGTNAGGVALPNGIGILAHNGPNTIGGADEGDGNVVRSNTGPGIQVSDAFSGPAPVGVRISGNSIDANGGAGIDLTNVSDNDLGDTDAFPNDGQNFPVITAAAGTAAATTVAGTLDTTASETFRIEVFASPACDPSGRGEGALYLGAVDVATDATGHGSFNTSFPVGIDDGDVVTATATDATGNTSELSACSTAEVDTTNGLTVNTTDDGDDGTCNVAHCSLREAILGANASPDRNAITFSVTGTIAPTSALPLITTPVDIDGGSSPACAGTPTIVIDGVSAGSNVNGLHLTTGSAGSTVRGLVVHRYGTGSGILISSNDNVVQCSRVGTNAAGTAAMPNHFGVEVQNGSGNLIGGTAVGQGNLLSGNSFQGARISGSGATDNDVKGNLIGTDVTGTTAIGNMAFGGVNLGGDANRVGGSEPGARNVISGNGHGIFLPNASTNHVIEGNWIGVDITGTAALANTSDGIAINGTPTPSSSGNVIRGNVISANVNSGVQISGTNAVGNTIEDNLIGVGADGTTALRNGHPSFPTAGWGVLVTSGNTTIRGNTIRNNATGVQVGTSVSSVVGGVLITENSMASNERQAIDLGGDGVTANDANDADSGPNGLQNHPLLTTATTAAASGTLDSAAGASYRIEVFASAAAGCDEAARFVGAADVTSDGVGHAAFTVPVTGVVAGEQLTATATTAGGSTSEVSPCMAATAGAGRVRIAKATTTPDGGTDFTFTGPGGATTGADGSLRGGDVVVYVDLDTSSLALLDPSSGETTALANTFQGRDPALSPDGSRVAFVTGGTLRMLDLDTGVVVSLPSSTPSGTKFSPTWSPDGQWLAFHHYSSDDIWVIRSDGSAPASLLAGSGTSDANPNWGPDGRLGFTRGGDIYVATFNSTTVALEGVAVLPNSTALSGVNRPFDWSPDGTRLVAAATPVNAQDDLYVLNADGTGTPVQLTSGTTWDFRPSWSPDGEEIAFVTDFGGDPKIRTIAVDGGGGVRSTALGDALALDPFWGESAVAGSDTYQLGDGDAVGGVVEPGRAVTFTEQATEGWLLEGIDCGDHPRAIIDGSSVTVTPEAGDDILCTFTNAEAPQTGTIVIKKETAPDGDPTTFAFSGATTASLADGESVSVTVPAGEHVVTETMPAAYWLPTSVVCDDADSTGATATSTASATYRVAVGETVTCTFTNQGFGRVRVGKASDPAGGTGFSFVETVGSNPPNPPMTIDDGQTLGGYGPAGLMRSFVESADPAWTLAAIDCSGHPRAVVSLADRKVTFTPAVGDDILCTFTNVQASGTVIVEVQTLPDGDPTEFGFSGAVSSSLGDGDTSTVSVPAGEHTVTETLPPTFWAAASIVCDDSDSAGDTTTASATFRVAPGETVRCVFTNQGSGYVTIAKTSDPAGGTGFGFTERLGTTVTGTVLLNDGQQATVKRPAGVTRTYTESATAGWALESIDCGDHPGAVTDVASRTVSVTPVVGEIIRCTFTNVGLPAVTVTKRQGNTSVAGSASGDPLTGVQPGDRLFYSVTARNDGPGVAGSVTITDPVTSRAQLISASSPCTLAGGELSCPVGDIQPGGSRTVFYFVQLNFGCDVAGTRGDDDLGATEASEKVCGFAGNDELSGFGGNDVILGDTPVDIDLSNITNQALASWTGPGGGGMVSSNTVVASLVRGPDGDDALGGDAGNDTIFGQDGDDFILGHDGAERLYGGNGDDRLHGGVDGDEVAGGEGIDDLVGWDGDDWLHGDQGNDFVRGSDGNDIATGDGGDDRVEGGDGNDFVSGDDGSDTLTGDRGADRVTGGADVDALFGDTQDGSSTFAGNDHSSVSVRINHPLQGGAPAFDGAGLYGQDGNDRLNGGYGGDTLFGGTGDDRLEGEVGNDDMWGGSGRDLLVGGDGDDLLLGDDPGTSDEGDGLPDRLLGGPGMDSLYGQKGNNITTTSVFGAPAGLWGDGDNDYIVGGPLADDAFGGAGSDHLRGGEGVDRLAGDLGDASSGVAPDAQGKGAADTVNGEEGRDLIYGQGGSEGHCTGSKCIVARITAGAARSRPSNSPMPGLSGDGGVDVLHGGLGHDRLEGGTGVGNVLVGADDVDHCSVGTGSGDIRDRSCDAAARGTAKVAASAWAWATFRP